MPPRSKPSAKPAPRGPQVIAAEDDEDGEVCISLELPQGKVEEFLRQIQLEQSALKESFPLAHTASVEAIVPPSGRKVDAIIPQPTLGFDPVAKLARLRELQERYSVVTEQRDKADRAKKAMAQMPIAGEPTSMPIAPPDSLGAAFGPGGPANLPPPFPPAAGLPFPYAGVPGVLEPRAKAPPEPVSDIANGDHWAEDEKALEEDADMRRLPHPDIVFVKDGLDMSLFQLRSHGERMAQDVREMGRRLDEANEFAEARQLRTQPEVMDQFMRQQRIIHEQQRKTDELQRDIVLEEERQFWVEREQRQRVQRRAYADRFPGAPEEISNDVRGPGDVGRRYDSTPPQLLALGQQARPDLQESEYKDAAQGRGASQRREWPAMEYVLAPDAPGDAAPLSYYEDELMPTQAFRQNLIQEAAVKGWPAASQLHREPPIVHEPRFEDEPEGEAPATGAGGRRRRAPRRIQEATPGEGLQIGGSRSSSALPAPDAAPAAGAPTSEAAFFSGWREGEAVPFGAFAGDREIPLHHESLRHPGTSALQDVAPFTGAGRDDSKTSAEGLPARSGISDMLMMPFAAFAGYSEAPQAPNQLNSAMPDSADGHDKARGELESYDQARRNMERRGNHSGWRTPPRSRDSPPFAAFAGDEERQQPRRGAERSVGTPPRRHDELPFCAFAGEEDGGKGRGKRAPLRRHDRASIQPPAPVAALATAPVGAAVPRLATISEPARVARVVRPEDAALPAGIDSDSEAASEEEVGWFGGVAAAVGLGDAGGGGLFGAAATPFEEEQHHYSLSVDHSAHYMAGACTDPAPPLVPPDHVMIEGRGYEAVVTTCDEVLATRRAGKLGDRLSAQGVLNYATAVSKSAKLVVEHDQGSRHVSILIDILNFYPVAVQIQLWALDGLVALYRCEDHSNQESLSGPIFDAVSMLMTTHENDPSLRESMSDAALMPRRILAALALVLTPATSPRLKTEHVDFTIGVIRSRGVGPSLMEHGLQLLLVARIAYHIREQAMIARAALRSFKAEPRLVTRALLTLGVAFEIAVEAAQPDEETPADGEAEDEEDLLLEGTSLARMNPKSSELSGVKKRIWEQRKMDQARLAHKALVETAPPLAGASAVQGPGKRPVKDHLVPIGLRDIITGMDLYAQDRKVQGAAAVCLAAAVMLPSVSFAAMKAEGVVRALILAQQHFSSSRSIALHLCQVLVQLARKDNSILSVDVAVTALNAGVSFARDAEVAVTALQVVHAFALRLHELCPDRSSRLNQMASDLVRLGEARHSNPHALGMLLVIFVAAASDGRGTGPGGVAGEQWRVALAGAAAVVVPLRVLYEHVDNIDLVLTAAIALRILTYGNKVSAAHAGRLRGVEALLGTIQKHHHRPDMARELLAALGNIGVDPAARELFSSKLPDAAEAIYNAMEKSGPLDPDVLTQGCRALGALTAGPKQESSRFAIDQNRIDKAVRVTSTGISTRLGLTEDTSGGGYLEIFTGTAEATTMRRKKLMELSNQLIDCLVACGPQFGRLVGKDGQLLAEVQPRRHAARSKTPTRRARQ